MSKGKIAVIGFGPGDKGNMTFRAAQAIEEADLIIGYKVYTDILEEHYPGKNYVSSHMMKEIERCKEAVQEAMKGKNVAMVSSGDSGIYGMAGAVYQVAGEMKADVDIDVIPGITAASAAASILGAPLMHDFAVISLSDLLTPLDLIMKRIEHAGIADLIVCIYNPKSKKRTDYVAQATDVLLRHRDPGTPVGIVRNIGREGQQKTLTTLGELKKADVDMFSTLIIGNSQTYVAEGMMITPRGYRLEAEQ